MRFSISDLLSGLRVRAPFLGSALAIMAGALFYAAPWWAGGLLIASYLFSPQHRGWWFCASLLAGFAAFKNEASKSVLHEVREFADLRYSEQEVSGVMVVGSRIRPGSQERLASLKVEGDSFKVRLKDERFSRVGDVYQVRGLLYLSPASRNPGEFSERRYWKEQSIAAGFRVDEWLLLETRLRSWPLRTAEGLQSWLRKTITEGIARDDPARVIILAMVMGESPGRASEVTKAFRHSGAMHVFAVSGLHVNLVAALVFGVLMVLGVPRRKAIWVVIIAAIFYALMTGFRPPAARATLMLIIFLMAVLARRRPSLFNSLAVSLILVVMWEPSQVMDVGFQLSYGVLAAIGLGFSFFHRFTKVIAVTDPFFPHSLRSRPAEWWLRLRRAVAGLLATSTAAWLGSLPLVVWKFGLVTPISIFASVLLIPLTFLVLGLGMLSGLTGLVHSNLSRGVNQANRQVAQLAYFSARKFSQVPGGNFRAPSKAPADVLVFDTADGGAATYLNFGGGVLVDLASRDRFQKIVGPALRRWNAPVNSVLITHPDGRHIGGISALLEDWDPRIIYLPVKQARSPVYREYFANAPVGQLVDREGDYPDWFQLIKAGDPADLPADDRGMIFKVSRNGWRILFMGDAGFEIEEQLFGRDLACDVIVMGRHGDHGYSGTTPFLKATGAKAIVISGGHYPSIEMVPDRWRRNVEKLEIELFWQKRTGGVSLFLEKDELILQSYLDPEKRVVFTKN